MLDEMQHLFPDEPVSAVHDNMSTIKKHLTSDTKHVLPTYKKLPPIQSPPPFTGLTITKLNKTNSPPSMVQNITSSDQTVVYDKNTMLQQNGDDSGGVKLIGYKTLDGQKKGYVPPGSELPPCRICGEKASGLHYGVNTCEACKAFFRRTLKKNSVDFQCMCSSADKKRNAEDPPRKTTCARCRYDRCIREGMSKDAIKIGRYTINRKRQNDREVNLLKEQGGVVGRRISEGSPKSSSSSADSPASTVSQKVLSPEVMSPDTTTNTDGEESNVGVANKRLKTNDGQWLAKGFLESLTNSLFQSLMQNQDTPVLNGGNTGSSEGLTPLEKLYMEPFNPTNSGNSGQYKTTIQVGKDSQNVIPVTSSQIQHIQKGSKVTQSVNTSTNLPKPGHNSHNDVQHNVNNPQTVVVPGQNLFISNSVGTGVNTNVTNTQETSLIETLFEASGTVPVQNDNSMIENMFRDPGYKPDRSPAISSTQTDQTSRTHPPHQPGTHTITDTDITHTDNTEETLNQILGDELLQSMEAFQQGEDNSLGSFADSFNLSDEVIASKLKSMEAHSLDTDALIASKLASMEQHDLDNSELVLANGDITPQQSDLIVTKLEGMSKQLTENTETGHETGETAVLSGSELTEFEMYQPQRGVMTSGESQQNTEHLQDICTTMIDTALAAYVCPLKLSCEEIKERHKKYLEQYQLRTKVFGDMNNIPQDEYLEFYNQTGIDIDNRQQILIEYLRYAEQCISELVTFSKVIPGFTALPIDDQVNLLKGARFSVLMIKDGLYGGQCRATRLQVATMPWNKEYHFDELKKVAPLKLFDMKASVYEKVYEIGMTVEESIIVKAMAMTYPKNEELRSPEQVEIIHNKMTECLLYQLQKRKTGKKPSLTSIFELLFYLREKSVVEQQYMIEMFETWPLTNNHQLLKEFVS